MSIRLHPSHAMRWVPFEFCILHFEFMNRLSVTIITLNEAAHIAAAINSASFADEVLIVDSGSSDGTTDIARSKGVRVLTRAWTGYVDQKNFAAQEASNDWIFSLDADERIPPALAEEIRSVLATDPPYHGYRAPRVTFHLGRWIRTTDFYPDYQTRLYDCLLYTSPSPRD